MKSQEAWNAAHKFFGNLSLKLGILLYAVSVLILFIFQNESDLSEVVLFGIIFVQLACLIYPIFPTESMLKTDFDENGKRK